MNSKVSLFIYIMNPCFFLNNFLMFSPDIKKFASLPLDRNLKKQKVPASCYSPYTFRTHYKSPSRGLKLIQKTQFATLHIEVDWVDGAQDTLGALLRIIRERAGRRNCLRTDRRTKIISIFS